MNRLMRQALGVAIFAGVLAIPATVWAQQAGFAGGGKAPARINRREFRQRHRIRQGVRSGELTRLETGRLVRQQARIRWHEARAKSDGVLTRQERRRLNRELNRSSRHIYRQKHDRQRRRG